MSALAKPRLLQWAAVFVLFVATRPLARGHGDVHDHIAQLRREIADSSPGQADAWKAPLQIAQLLHAHGESAPAREELSGVLRRWPDCAAAWVLQARMEEEASDFAAAMQSLSHCQGAEKENPRILAMQAGLKHKLGDFRGAEEAWRRSVERNERPLVEDYLGWMEAAFAARRIAPAPSAKVSPAPPASPNSPEIREDQPALEEALRVARLGMEKLGRTPAFYRTAADLCARAGRHELGAEWISRMRRETIVEKSGTYLEEGRMLWQGGMTAAAKNAWEEGMRQWDAQPERKKLLPAFLRIRTELLKCIGPCTQNANTLANPAK